MDFSFLPVEEEERLCSGQPSARGALISHLDVICGGLHRENSVYCNRDHNYHRLALSQEQTCVVCVCVRTRTRLCTGKDICTCINGLILRKWCLSKPTFKQTRTHPFHVAIFWWVLFQLKWFKQNINNCTMENNDDVPRRFDLQRVGSGLGSSDVQSGRQVRPGLTCLPDKNEKFN